MRFRRKNRQEQSEAPAGYTCDHEGWAADTSGQVSGQPERSQPNG